jgi:gamma-glutamyltranspeptidase
MTKCTNMTLFFILQLRNLAETGTVSASQAIRRFMNGTIHAASDPRKQGVAAAY